MFAGDHLWARRRPRRWRLLAAAVVVAGAGFAAGALSTRAPATIHPAVTLPTVPAAANPGSDNCLVEPLGPTSLYRLSVRDLRVDVLGPSFYYCNVSDGDGSGAAVWVEGTPDTSRDQGSIGISIEACVTCNFEAVCPYSAFVRAALAEDAGSCTTKVPASERVTYLLGSTHTHDVMVELLDPETPSDAQSATTVLAFGPGTELATLTCTGTVHASTYCANDAATFATSMRSEFFDVTT